MCVRRMENERNVRLSVKCTGENERVVDVEEWCW